MTAHADRTKASILTLPDKFEARRARFYIFVQDLRVVLQGFEGFETFLDGFPASHTLPELTKEQDDLLLLLINARSDTICKGIIRQQNSKSGRAVLLYFKTLCAQYTQNHKDKVQRDYLIMERSNQEYASSFLKRFNAKFHDLRACEALEVPSELSKINRFLAGMRSDPAYDTLIQSIKLQISQSEQSDTFPPPTWSDVKPPNKI